MTPVRIKLTRPTAAGTRVPAKGRLVFRPSMRHHHPDLDPSEVVLPSGFAVMLEGTETNGVVVHLEPTPVNMTWAWTVIEKISGGMDWAFTVPDTTEELIYGPDLLAIDVETLPMPAEAVAGWTVALASTQQAAAEAVGAAGEAEASAIAAQTAETTVQGYATAAAASAAAADEAAADAAADVETAVQGYATAAALSASAAHASADLLAQGEAVLVLSAAAPVPGGTPVGTVILRTAT